LKQLLTHQEVVEEVRKVFPQAACTGYNAQKGFCVFWPTETNPVVATGQHPRKAWKNAYKLIKNKNKKALDKLKKSILEHEVKKGFYGPGA
jgi:hypothetical protein